MRDDFGDEEEVVVVGELSRWGRVRSWCRGGVRRWVDVSIPADDDVGEGVPEFFRGVRGRVVLAVVAVGVSVGWGVVLFHLVY